MVSAQRDTGFSDDRSIRNRTAEPAVLLPSLSNIPSDNIPVGSAHQQQVRPAPAPPVEQSDANPVGDAVLLPLDKTPGSRIATKKGSAPATVHLESFDWNDHAGIDDQGSAGTGQSLLWLVLAVVVGSLLGVSIRRFRRKPIHSHDS